MAKTIYPSQHVCPFHAEYVQCSLKRCDPECGWRPDTDKYRREALRNLRRVQGMISFLNTRSMLIVTKNPQDQSIQPAYIICPYNSGVYCDTFNCANCGWNFTKTKDAKTRNSNSEIHKTESQGSEQKLPGTNAVNTSPSKTINNLPDLPSKNFESEVKVPTQTVGKAMATVSQKKEPKSIQPMETISHIQQHEAWGMDDNMEKNVADPSATENLPRKIKPVMTMSTKPKGIADIPDDPIISSVRKAKGQ